MSYADDLPSDFVFAARRLADHQSPAIAKWGEDALTEANNGLYGVAMARLEHGEYLASTFVEVVDVAE